MPLPCKLQIMGKSTAIQTLDYVYPSAEMKCPMIVATLGFEYKFLTEFTKKNTDLISHPSSIVAQHMHKFVHITRDFEQIQRFPCAL